VKSAFWSQRCLLYADDLHALLISTAPCSVQLEEREAEVAGLEARAAELAQQRAACDALAAQLQRRAEAIAAEAEAASQATEVPACI
jgi:chromosome segregation ATPase